MEHTTKLFDDIMGQANNLFALMDDVEVMIAEYQRKHPAKKAELWDAFKTVMPTHNMTMYRKELFLAHCEELLDRIVAGEDLRPATNAEILAVFVRVSAAAPFHGNAAYAYYVTFAKVFGEPDWGVELRENYDGASHHILHEVRLKAGDKNRHKPDPQRWHRLQAFEAAEGEVA